MSGPSPIITPSSVFDGGSVSQNILAPGFSGLANSPALLPYGLKSPWTRTVIVDAGSKGDFTTIKAACDYVATQTHDNTHQWVVLVSPGRYTEDPFTVPSFTSVVGRAQDGPSMDGNTAATFIFKAGIVSGAFVTLTQSSTLAGVTVVCTATTPSGNATAVDCTVSGRIANCVIAMIGDATSYIISGVKHSGASNAALEIFNSTVSVTSTGGTGNNLRNVWDASNHGISMGYSILASVQAGVGFWEGGGGTQSGIYFCRFGFSSGTTFSHDIYVEDGGIATVNNSPYKNGAVAGSGKITHLDRWFPSLEAIREAPAATDTPTINKGASAQTADLEQWQSSTAAVLASVSSVGVYRGAGIQLPHVVNKAASANIRNSHDAEATSTSATYVKAKTITLTNGLVGQARFLFDIKTSNVLDTAYGKIYRNGVALGTEQTDATGVYATKSQDITQDWNPGDTCELWIHEDGTNTVSVQNFRVAYDDAPVAAVASANS